MVPGACALPLITSEKLNRFSWKVMRIYWRSLQILNFKLHAINNTNIAKELTSFMEAILATLNVGLWEKYVASVKVSFVDRKNRTCRSSEITFMTTTTERMKRNFACRYIRTYLQILYQTQNIFIRYTSTMKTYEVTCDKINVTRTYSSGNYTRKCFINYIIIKLVNLIEVILLYSVNSTVRILHLPFSDEWVTTVARHGNFVWTRIINVPTHAF
jgi:hypothetical protein